MGWLHNLFSKVKGFVSSPKITAAENEIAHLVVVAAPIVATISKYVPNGTVQEVAMLYANYGVPLAVEQLTNSTAINDALKNLAAMEVKKIVPTATTVNTNTAVELAVVQEKAK